MKKPGEAVTIQLRLGLVVLLILGLAGTAGAADCDERVTAEIRVVAQHPWRPPFGLERIGQPLTIAVELSAQDKPYREYWLAGFSGGKEIVRQILKPGSAKSIPGFFVAQASFVAYPEEAVLFARCRFEGEPVEIVRKKIDLPGLQAEAIAKPDRVINPVDLGTILVPHEWLLLTGGQKAEVSVAAIHYSEDVKGAMISAWYESAAKGKILTPFDLEKGKRRQERVSLPPASATLDRDSLHISITRADGKELWRKTISSMIVPQSHKIPSFGAIETKLRYDAPISVRNPKTGALSTMDYSSAWKPELKDVVVFLPNRSRFVFWRGSCYIPFWAGKNNTGISYEWAETIPPADGFTDSVEPLMDKELRYGSVEIVESTSARVHVRWTYQSNDFNYKVWGDAPVEDFYFYPDGYGTRVLTLRSALKSQYEVLEYIVLTPQGSFPYDVLNPKTAEILFVDGQKRLVSFPPPTAKPSSTTSFARSEDLGEPRDLPAIYRMRFHKDDNAGAISFNPIDTHLPIYLFSPFYDRGAMVTPYYWGSHWPLARGNSTGWAIDDRVTLTPAHNSIMGWGLNRQTPLSSFDLQSIDTLGQSRLMNVQRWVWLIGANDDPDDRLLQWAASFSKPPSVEVRGARLDPEPYSTERRAIRAIVDDQKVEFAIKPGVRCVNPVFELQKAPQTLTSLQLGSRQLAPNEYAWDGKTLWLNVTLSEDTVLRLDFAAAKR